MKDPVTLLSALGTWYLFFRDRDPDFKQSYVTLNGPEVGKPSEEELSLVQKLKVGPGRVVGPAQCWPRVSQNILNRNQIKYQEGYVKMILDRGFRVR